MPEKDFTPILVPTFTKIFF